MKVTNVRTFLVHPSEEKNWLFVKVETDGGIHGWGECYTQADRDRTIEIYVQELARYLIGRSPFNIKHFTFMAYHDFANKRGAMDLYCAISGIEQALWDIVGKAFNTPVYNLLGGHAGIRFVFTPTAGAGERLRSTLNVLHDWQNKGSLR